MKKWLVHINRALDRKFNIRLSRLSYSKNSYKSKLSVVGGCFVDKSTRSCVSDYWGGVRVDPKFIALYNAINNTDSFDERFVPDDLYYCYIDPFLNNTEVARWMDDKNYYDLLFKDVPQPEVLARKMNGYLMNGDYVPLDSDTIIEHCKGTEEVIVKKSIESEGGKGVRIVNTQTEINELKKMILESDNFVIQKVIKQHPSLAAIHPSSINTIRILSLLLNGEVHILSTILRMGRGGSRVDNASSGGIFCGIDDAGRLRKFAYDVDGHKWDKHPSGIVFENYFIPGLDKCQEIVRDKAMRLARFSRMPSWDFAIDDEGNPVFIEVNMAYGELDFHQMTNGPLFKDLTQEVVKEVFADRRKKLLRRFI